METRPTAGTSSAAAPQGGADAALTTPAGSESAAASLRSSASLNRAWIRTLSGRSRVLLAALGVLAIVALAAVVASGLAQPSPSDVAGTFIEGLASRDVEVGARLADPSRLSAAATGLGFAPIPASVGVVVNEMTATPVGESSGQQVTLEASWLTKLTAGDQHPLVVQSSALLTMTRDPELGWLIFSVNPIAPVAFDLRAYVAAMATSKGISQANRDAVVADLNAGTAWLSGSVAVASQSMRTMQVDPTTTSDPDTLVSSSRVTDSGSDGEAVTWQIRVANPVDGGSFTVDLGEEVTRAARPQQVIRGSLTTEEVTADALAALTEWGDLVAHGDDGANAFMTEEIVTEAAWAEMRAHPPTGLDRLNASIAGAPGSIVVTFAGPAAKPAYVLVRQKGGGWLIDTSRTTLMYEWKPGQPDTFQFEEEVRGDGCYGTFPGHATMAVSFIGVAFYTTGVPVASFRITRVAGDWCAAHGATISAFTGTVADQPLDLGAVAYQVGNDQLPGEDIILATVELPSTLKPGDGEVHFIATLEPSSYRILGRATKGGTGTFATTN